ncbi:MAG: hypothetical protein KF784_07760 [Fimbriimonadaceae bacterium]|nr:hypothetical protein [Fimbriimonadaceae bacterium]
MIQNLRNATNDSVRSSTLPTTNMSDTDPYQGWQPLKPVTAELNEFNLSAPYLHRYVSHKQYYSQDAPNKLRASIKIESVLVITAQTDLYSAGLVGQAEDASMNLMSVDGKPLGKVIRNGYCWSKGVIQLTDLGEHRFRRRPDKGCDFLNPNLETVLTFYSAWQDAKTEQDISFYAQWPAEKTLPDHYPVYVAVGLLVYAWSLYVESDGT